MSVNLNEYTGREASGAGRLDRTDEREADVIRTPAEWIEGLVQQMASAKDLADARTRAAGELRSFEQAVMRTTNKVLVVIPLSRQSFTQSYWKVFGVSHDSRAKSSSSSTPNSLPCPPPPLRGSKIGNLRC